MVAETEAPRRMPVIKPRSSEVPVFTAKPPFQAGLHEMQFLCVLFVCS